MKFILSIEFKNSSFWKKTIDFILKNVDIKFIEYEKNYELKRISANKIIDLKTSELVFNLNEHIDSYISLQNRNNALPRLFANNLDKKLLLKLRNELEKSFLNLIETGYLNDENQIRNIENVNYYKSIKGYIPDYIEIIPNPKYVEGAPGMDMIEKEFISIESLPGHSHQMGYEEKLWFGSSWQMYFSPVYYKYIPKFLFDNFQDCYEHLVFGNGLRRITLFESPEDYELAENRAKQWEFRRQLGIDSIAHELTLQSNRIEPKNLPVLITKKNCKIGQTKVTRFLDENGNLVPSNLAKQIEIREYLNDGITLVFEQLIIN